MIVHNQFDVGDEVFFNYAGEIYEAPIEDINFVKYGENTVPEYEFHMHDGDGGEPVVIYRLQYFVHRHIQELKQC